MVVWTLTELSGEIMDKDKLAESELLQKLVVNEPASDTEPESDPKFAANTVPIDESAREPAGEFVAEPSTHSMNDWDARDAQSLVGNSQNAASQVTNPRKASSGKREPALIRVKDIKSRNEKRDPRSASVQRRRFTYMLIGTMTAVIAAIAVPVAWTSWMILSNAYPNSPFVKMIFHEKPWPEAKLEWQQKIAGKLSTDTYLPSLLANYGEALIKHREYKDALSIFDRCSEVTNANLKKGKDNWVVYIALQKAICEHQLYRRDHAVKLNIDRTLEALKISKTLSDEKWRTAALTAILGNMYADIGNLKIANQYFDEAAVLFGKLEGQTYYQEQAEQDQWRANMTAMSADILKMPIPAPTKLGTGHGDPVAAKETLALLSAKKFEQLNKVFEQATKQRVQHRSGAELIDDLYRSLSDPGDSAQDKDWKERLSLLEEWAAFKPASATPHVVLADFYIQYAWNARGSGWGKDVKDWQRQLFKDRLFLSAKQLQASLAFGTPGPEWFSVAQVNILGTGSKHDRRVYDAITAAGKRLYPNYAVVDMNKVYYLQPRWFGSAQQWVDYTTKQADALGGDEGDKLYARLIGNVVNLFSDVYKEAPGLDIKRAAHGNELLDKQFGSRE